MRYTLNAANKDESARPFLKWAGGKGQLLAEIERYYPFVDGKTKKYAEPFVGGGAVLFDVLNKYDLDSVYIGDTNSELINTYIVIRDSIDDLIEKLYVMQNQFIPLDLAERKAYYIKIRNIFNETKLCNDLPNIDKAALMIFLNRTCFNGLFRVNKSGYFNVPIGNYRNPLICDEANLRVVSKKLKSVIIVCGDYKQSSEFIDENTFAYFDPPYRPLNGTSNFTAYTKDAFDDRCQMELARFVTDMRHKGAKIVVSNSDPQNTNDSDTFFRDLYSSFTVKSVKASRMINCNSNARGKIGELLISNI